jgi:beta-glucosidase
MTKQPAPLSFPKRFFWGASVAAHQVEGGNHNQWSVWELENARALAEQAKYQANYLPKWGAVKDEASNPENYVSGNAVDHYNLYEKDFAALKKLNMNSFRFSIEWSRIEPEEGAWNAEAIEHYRNYLRALNDRNIEPFVTLWHWTMPVWFTQKGGFEKKSNIKYFVRFAEKVFQELGREFRYVITLNEPEVYVSKSYFLGEWPPQQQGKLQALRVYLNLIKAHKKVYKLAHGISRKFLLGVAKNSIHHYPGDDAIITRIAARITTWGADYFILNRIKRHLDFIGVNYYFSNRFYGYRIHNANEQLNDLGWDMQPQDIQFVLERLHDKYNLPLIVTENGLADRDDQYRKWWLTQTMLAMHKALQNGVKLQGYLHWSLLDNFEWASGFWPKFGLIAVDRKTMKRTARPSAVWFSQAIAKLRER